MHIKAKKLWFGESLSMRNNNTQGVEIKIDYGYF